MDRYRTIIVMGVTGSGKTTVGRLLAHRLSLPFVDADDLHPESNLTKMAMGHPLDDADRWPWLHDVAAWIDEHPRGVVACSALKRSYRDLLRHGRDGVRFLYLQAEPHIIKQRMERRQHFMPPSLADSQLATLEPPDGNEPAVTVSIVNNPEVIVETAVRALGPQRGIVEEDQ